MVDPTEVHALYRFFGLNDELLYIGITFDPPMRFRQHSTDKPWWAEVSRIGIETFPSRRAVLEAERRAIITERPRWNITYNARPVAVASDPVAVGGRIRWACGICEMEIWSGGALYVDLRRASEILREQVKDDHRRFLGPVRFDDALYAALLSVPRFVRWHVACDACFNENDCSYDISLDQCRSLAALIRWTAHLYGKSWFRATDWIYFTHEVAQMTGSPLETVGVF